MAEKTVLFDLMSSIRTRANILYTFPMIMRKKHTTKIVKRYIKPVLFSISINYTGCLNLGARVQVEFVKLNKNNPVLSCIDSATVIIEILMTEIDQLMRAM